MTCALVLSVALSATVPVGRAGPLQKEDATRVDGVSQNAMGVCLAGKTLYAVGGGVLYVLDVREPLKPRLLSRLGGMDNNRQIVVQDGFAYIVSRETGLRIVDVRDPLKPRLRSRYDTIEMATGIDVVGKTAFVSERIYGIEVVDVSDPDRPAHVCVRKTGESQSNRYRDGYLYSGEWGGGRVQVFDARDLADFRSVGELDLGGFGDGVEIDGGYLYCSTGHDAKHRHAREVAAPAGAGHGLDVFSLADPAKPTWVARANFPVFKPRNEDFWTPRVANGLAFCCDSHNGLFVVDVKNPAKPAVVDRFCVPQEGKDWPSAAISSCAIGEGCVYVTAYPGGLWVVPVTGVTPPSRPKGTPPAHPDYRERYATDARAWHVYRPAASGQARTVAVRGAVAYAAFGDAGLHVLRLSGDGFAKMGELPGARRVTDCCFVGNRLVTAEGADGFAVYELDGPAAFREVARRRMAVTDMYSSAIAFWCWPAVGDKVVLTTRFGPYQVFDLKDFDAPRPLLKFWGGCPWDKYVSDGAVNGRLPVLMPYIGLAWYDFNGETSFQVRSSALRKAPVGGQTDGICRMGVSRYLYTIPQPRSDVYDYKAAAYYVIVEADGTCSDPLALPPVPAFGKGAAARFSGIPRASGHLVLMTNRSLRKVVVWDFADVKAPRVLRAYSLSGNPDIGAFWGERAVVPAGHQGLLMERIGALRR